MKLDISEVFFVKSAIDSCSIKASDAGMVYSLQVKIDKEFDRLKKIEDKKAEL